MLEIILIIVILAIFFDISNGWNDSANAIATVVSTRVLSPLQAVIMAAAMNILGAFVFTAVAKTIGSGIVSPTAVTDTVVIAALVTATLWNTVMTKFGMPISCSHALISGLIGASIAYGGAGILNVAGITKIFLSLLISPFVGLLLGYLFMTPFIKPRRFSRFFWTYLVPVVPLATCWDGVVSLLRVYPPGALKALTAAIPAPGYTWEIGLASTGTPIFEYTYLVGYPQH